MDEIDQVLKAYHAQRADKMAGPAKVPRNPPKTEIHAASSN
jgi:hypothetical protein